MIRSLNNYEYVTTIKVNTSITSMLVIQNEVKNMLVSGCVDGTVSFFNLEGYSSTGRYNAHQDSVNSLKFIRCNDKDCVSSVSNDSTIQIWDLNSKNFLAGIKNNSTFHEIKVFNYLGQPCLAIGNNTCIKLWMENDFSG